jgi:H+/Cl- antiporter ClcA
VGWACGLVGGREGAMMRAGGFLASILAFFWRRYAGEHSSLCA